MKFTAKQAREAILKVDEKRVERVLDKIYKRIQSNCETSYVRGIYCDADTFFASSKTCSCCGWKNSDLKLTDRVFECKMCDMKMDRDYNASLNLKQIYTGSSSGIYASGDGSSSNTSLISPSLNEEFNKKSRVYILKR